ncbi:DUF4920 domain-containing protein [Cesiribacter andamanensis]|uniref:DUF4920 domain-containing protein n=1 Tax=Cesiribacter andamanensis AMV16 TaxID=1279009 RepID=M7MXL2_9BACT|nr:DUF4920 domain-containing protein [Cesiribacter andamanensis]EMR01183.1 hypothetical protein ADICEAN_03687 [Cesiribacter andamanensis AMV16]
MKNLLLATGLLALLGACQPAQQDSAAETNVPTLQGELATSYGAEIDTEGALSARQVPSLLQNIDSTYVTLSGTALSSCAKKGCWMKVAVTGDEDMRVTFKDYGFFVPKDLNGQEVVMEGTLKRKVSSVEELRHFAEDAGKSPEEIAAIQQADTIYSFEAVGVKIWPAPTE